MVVPARPTSGASIESAWGSIVHDGIVDVDIQYGTAIAPATGSGVDNSGVTVVWPRPFRAGSIPVVVVTGSGSGPFVHTAYNISATACSMASWNRTVGAGSLGTRTMMWVAIGPRA